MDAFKPENTTVIICAAGMGTRLGIGTTKALVDIDGVPLIIRQLDLLKDYDDIRIVVGFQAEKLIKVVKEYRKDIVFAFNYDYETTGVADSLRKGLFSAREYIVSLDGDVLVNEEDFNKFLTVEYSCLGITSISSAEPIKALLEYGMVKKLSKTGGNMQWPGVLKVKKDMIIGSSAHVYDVLNEVMPIRAHIIRAREIDTQEDYERVIEWFENGGED